MQVCVKYFSSVIVLFQLLTEPHFKVTIKVKVIWHFSVSIKVTVNWELFFSYFAISVRVTVILNFTAWTLDGFERNLAGGQW